MKYRVAVLILCENFSEKTKKCYVRWHKALARKFKTKAEAVDYARYFATKSNRKVTLQKLGGKNRGKR